MITGTKLVFYTATKLLFCPENAQVLLSVGHLQSELSAASPTAGGLPLYEPRKVAMFSLLIHFRLLTLS